MAKRIITVEQLTTPEDHEVQQFAKELYNYLWIKFKIVVPGRIQTMSSDNNPIFTEEIGLGVLCEQMVMRRVVLGQIFFPRWVLVINSNPKSAYTFCEALCNNEFNWSYGKRFFRCCAIISEFFLYRQNLVERDQLGMAERVFEIVFKDFLTKGWFYCGSWRGLDRFAKERINPIYNSFEYYVDNLTDPIDYNPPYIGDLPASYELDYEYRYLWPFTQSGLNSEIWKSFLGLFYMYSRRASEDAADQLMNISLREDRNSLPSFKPIEKKYENVDAASSTVPVLKDENEDIQPWYTRSMIMPSSPTKYESTYYSCFRITQYDCPYMSEPLLTWLNPNPGFPPP